MSDETPPTMKEYKSSWINDLLVALLFLTRIPLKINMNFSMAAVGSSVRCFPLVGLVVGGISGGVFFTLNLLGLPVFVCATIAVGLQILITGALHEDAIGDVADGFGGGATKDKKLEIMRDSRVGTYAVVTLIIAITLKITAIGSMYPEVLALPVIISAAVASRGMLAWGMYLMPSARKDGLGASAGKPQLISVVGALIFTIIIPVALIGPFAASAALLGAFVSTGLMGWIAHRQIGGQTGDVLGSLQQVSEITFLVITAGLFSAGLGA